MDAQNNQIENITAKLQQLEIQAKSLGNQSLNNNALRQNTSRATNIRDRQNSPTVSNPASVNNNQTSHRFNDALKTVTTQAFQFTGKPEA